MKNIEKYNWIEEAFNYSMFLDLENPHINNTKEAKQYIKELIEFIVSTNGIGYLTSYEKDMGKKLKIKQTLLQ